MAIATITGASISLSRTYRESQKSMALSLERLGSLKKFQTASQDTSAYIKVNNLQISETKFSDAKESIQKGQSFLEIADGWSTQMHNQLVALKSAVANHETSVATGITNSIKDSVNATYNGLALNKGTNKFDTVRMADDTVLDLTMAQTKVIDTAALTTVTQVQSALDKLDSFANTISQFKHRLEFQSSFVSTMSDTTNQAIDKLTEVDEAAELKNYTDMDIRQQTSIAMISQANMSRRSILGLFR